MNRRHHHLALRHHGRRPGGIAAAPVAALVAGGVLITGGVAVVVSMLAFVVLTLLPVAAFGLAVGLIVRHQVRQAWRRRGGHPVAVPALAPRPRLDVAWRQARARFAAVRGEYAGYECDAMNVLRLPALADVSVPSTGRFVDAFAQAQALETDALPPPAHAAEYVAAVDRAHRAWRAACDAAERIRLSRLSPAERGSVERAIKLLTTARDSDSDAERLAAYALARTELAKLAKAGVVHLPRTAQAVLDAAARGQLPA